MNIDQILARFRKQKSVTQQTLQLLKQQLDQKKISRISLWEMNSPTKFLMKMAKGQIVLIALAGLTVFPYIMYQRYLSEPQKRNAIMIATPVVSLVMLLPLFYFKRFSSKMLSELSFNTESKQFIFQGLKKGSTIKAHPNNVKFTLTNNNRIKDIEIADLHKKFSIQGAGKWDSLQLFKHIVQKKQL